MRRTIAVIVTLATLSLAAPAPAASLSWSAAKRAVAGYTRHLARGVAASDPNLIAAVWLTRVNYCNRIGSRAFSCQWEAQFSLLDSSIAACTGDVFAFTRSRSNRVRILAQPGTDLCQNLPDPGLVLTNP